MVSDKCFVTIEIKHIYTILNIILIKILRLHGSL